jgi:signal transduction histidine kinase
MSSVPDPRPHLPWWLREPWRDPLVAAAFFTCGALLYLARLDTLVSGGTDVSLGVWLSVLALACCGSIFRARRPVLALTVGVTALAIAAGLSVNGTFGSIVPLLLVVADQIFAATLYGSRRTSRAMVVLAAVILVGSGVVTFALTGDWRQALILAWVVGTLPIIPVWWAMNIRQHREMVAAERERSEQLARIAELDRRAAISAERARMARDLHDVVAGHLSAIAIQSEAVLSMADKDPATVRKVLEAVRENAVSSLTEMRAMIRMLRSDDEDSLVAPARLRDVGRLVESARAGGLRVEVRSNLPMVRGELTSAASVTREPAADGACAQGTLATATDTSLPAAVDQAAYRVVQEALTNAVKHAPGAQATLSVEQSDGHLVVEVTNDLTTATGATPTSEAGRAGTGLISMRERAEAVGGTLDVGPDGRTWRVRAVLPTKGWNL